MTHDVTKTPAENLLVDLKKQLSPKEYERAFAVIMGLQRTVKRLLQPSVPAGRGSMYLS